MEYVRILTHVHVHIHVDTRLCSFITVEVLTVLHIRHVTVLYHSQHVQLVNIVQRMTQPARTVLTIL